MMVRVASVHTLIALLLTGPIGHAQEAPADPRVAQARAQFERADEHYQAGDYALALEGYQSAYDTLAALGHPNAALVIFNIARTNERLGRVQVALEGFERFLVEAPADAPYRDDATRHAADLRRRIELQQIDAPPTSGGGVSPVGPVIAAVGGAIAIGGAILGGVALSESDSARAGCVDTRCPSDARPGIESAQTLANVADGLLFGGLAVAAVGVVLVFVLTDGGDTEATAACGPTGCVVRGTF